VETAPVKGEASYVFVGIPDAGLVGSIALTYMVESLSMQEVGYIDSELFPPSLTVRNGEIKNPVRIYYNSTNNKANSPNNAHYGAPGPATAPPPVAPSDNSSSPFIDSSSVGKDIFVIISDISLLPTMYVQFAKALVDLMHKLHPKLVINVIGIAVQNRQQIETPEVIGLSTPGSGSSNIRSIGTSNDTQPNDLISSLGISKFSHGALGGPYAALIKACMTHDIPTLTLLVQAYPHFPDPAASVEALKLISRLTGENIPLTALQENAEMVRVKARELMKQTDETMVEDNKIGGGGNIDGIYG
jgi:uncharacterized protein